MALIVETGEGLPNADSYNSVAELDAYMLRLGYDDWPVSPVAEPDAEPDEAQTETQTDDATRAKKEAAARRAALYIDSKYALRFSGVPVSTEQGLAWPRKDATDYYGRDIADNVVPKAIKNAHAEVTHLAFTGVQLSPQTSAGPLLKRKKIDVLEWEYDVDSYSEAPVFGWVDQVLLPLLGPAEQVGALDVMGIERA